MQHQGYKAVLSESFTRKILQTWGHKGVAWVEDFPRLLETACFKWKLTGIEPAEDLSYNFVAYARRSNGAVVLKIAVIPTQLENEARALEALGPGHAAKLIDHDPEIGALLLDRLLPGTSLWTTWSPEVDREQTGIAARLIASARTPSVAGFPSISDWFRSFDRCLTKADLEHRHRHLIERARTIGADLNSRQDPPACLLHGDLHHGNILRAGTSWKMIDPKGVVGDLGFEIGAFLRNPYDRILEAPDLETLLQNRLKIFAEILGVDRDRLLRWAFCACVLSACWSIEDNEPAEGAAISCAAALASKIA